MAPGGTSKASGDAADTLSKSALANTEFRKKNSMLRRVSGGVRRGSQQARLACVLALEVAEGPAELGLQRGGHNARIARVLVAQHAVHVHAALRQHRAGQAALISGGSAAGMACLGYRSVFCSWPVAFIHVQTWLEPLLTNTEYVRPLPNSASVSWKPELVGGTS